MNLIINSNPKPDDQSVSGTLAQMLVQHLDGPSHTLRIYEESRGQGYFQFQHHEPWMEQFVAARRLILPVPMWNYAIPAALKDFFDKITKINKVWKLENNQFVGLLTDRPVYIIMTSGLAYPPGHRQDFVVPYLKVFFEFLGIHDVRDFRVSGVTRSAKLVADASYMAQLRQDMLRTFQLP